MIKSLGMLGMRAIQTGESGGDDRNILTCLRVVVVRVAYTRNLLSDEGSG